MNLVGLTIEEPRPRGGFSYNHPPTGFKFEIVRDDSDSEDEDGGGLVFNPLSYGTAKEVCTSCSSLLTRRTTSGSFCNFQAWSEGFACLVVSIFSGQGVDSWRKGGSEDGGAGG